MKEEQWKKWPIGKFHGHSVYIELPPTLSGKETDEEWSAASLWLERSFKDDDFRNNLREFLDL